jgi:thiamine pyrophosphokinase
MGTEKVLIFGSRPCDSWQFLDPLRREDRLVICADGGINCARREGFEPSVYIGDGDSGGVPIPGMTCVTLPVEKDWTDLEAAYRWAVDHGGRDIVFTACTGGRQDHHLAALSLLETAAEDGIRAAILDPCNRITCLLPGTYPVETAGYRFFSLLPMDRALEGVTITGAKYPLQNAVTRRGSSLTVSNESLGGPVTVTIGKGRCWLICSNDAKDHDKG